MDAAKGYEQLLEAMAETARLVDDPQRGGGDAEGKAAGYLYATELARLALDLYADADPGAPRFVPFSTPTPYHAGDLALQRVQGGANPDGLYDFALLDPSLRYRISGRRGNDCYFSLSFSGGDEHGGWPTRTVATLNDRQLTCLADGSFTVTIAAESDGSTDWVQMEPDVRSVIIRQYFDVPPADRQPASLRIEVLDPPVAPALADVAGHRLAAAAAFIRSTNEHFPLPGGLGPNTFTPPLGYGGEAGALGTTDNAYCMGRWQLDRGQRLVVDITPTACAYWSIQLWNHWGQSLTPAVDADSYPNLIVNASRASAEADGTVRVIVSEDDPGHPNWLRTWGWRSGAMIIRFLHPDEQPHQPAVRVEG